MSVETPEYAAMVRRIIRAHGRRVASDADPIDLADLAGLHAVVDAAVREAVAGLRERHSWAEIAAGLGVSRQAACQRFGRVSVADGVGADLSSAYDSLGGK